MRELIKRLRAELGLSQSAFALKTDISESMVARVETGDRQFGLENIEKIIETFDLSDQWAADLKAARKEAPKTAEQSDEWRSGLEDRLVSLERDVATIKRHVGLDDTASLVADLESVVGEQAVDDDPHSSADGRV